MGRPRTTRRNPVPGTKSTQSRYYLGYFVFVDDPDTGFAVSIRAAAPVGESPASVAIDSARDKAQRLSNKLGRSIAFMPLAMTQATKAEAIEHLYGPGGSTRFGGPHAHAKVTLSRSRLPNRPVVETALPSVQAHWAALYGPGVQRKWPRGSPRLRSTKAYTVEGAEVFAPRVVLTRKTRAELAQEAERRKARLEKLRAMEASPERQEAATARALADREAAKLAEVDAQLSFHSAQRGQAVVGDMLEAAELEPTRMSKAWALRLLRSIPEDMQDGEAPMQLAQNLAAFVDSAIRKMMQDNKGTSVARMIDLFYQDPAYADYRVALKEAGLRGRGVSALFQATVQVLSDPDSNP